MAPEMAPAWPSYPERLPRSTEAADPLVDGLASACLETLKRCVDTEGDWRLTCPEIVWRDDDALAVIRAALVRYGELSKTEPR